MRMKMKEQLHSSHIGLNGCLRRARELMYWPEMMSEIKEHVSQCEACSKYGTKEQKETLMSHEIAERPWEKIGTALYTIDGKEYLVVVDHFSNFWEMDPLPDTKASTMIKKLKCHFARLDWGFEHHTGSPGHQQTNGKAEVAVREAIRLLRKSKETSGDIYLVLLALRNKPRTQAPPNDY
ncbi:hypothetical protein QZH41_003084 [Actinostola sp. cb2023]|nr:hypothetical protein QZH41_003084 [Actinostola sp. cb2023]